MQNLEQTIISQYANSPVLMQLIQNMNEYLDPQANIQAFYDNIWNVQTAIGYGLDVWGKIVGVSRQLSVPQSDFFGFSQGDLQPFGQAPLYPGPVRAPICFRTNPTDYSSWLRRSPISPAPRFRLTTSYCKTCLLDGGDAIAWTSATCRCSTPLNFTYFPTNRPF